MAPDRIGPGNNMYQVAEFGPHTRNELAASL
jgi:hypothetical protein